MRKKWQKLYLSDILSSMMKIRTYIFGLSQEEFSKNGLIIDAVIRNLEIIGEASNRLSSEFRVSQPHVPWSKMTGLRNLIIHEYFGVDSAIIWTIITRDLPETLSAIESIVASSDVT